MRGRDVVVVGAGISGAATAYELAAAGVAVTLLDRWGPAAMASGWTLAGVRQSGRHPAELPLAQAAVADWEHLAVKLDAPTGYTRRGNLRLARTEADRDALAEMVAAQGAAGLALQMLDGPALREVAPAIAPTVPAASYCATDGHADPQQTVAAFVAAAQRAGATLRFGERAVAVETEGGRVTALRTERDRIACGRVVLATGVIGNDLLRPFGLEIPMVPRAVTVLRSAPGATVLHQVVGVADASCAGRQELDGRWRFTGSGGAVPAGLAAFPPGAERPRLRPPVGEVARVAGLFGALVPAALQAELDETWVGLIDATPDALPVIEAAEEPRGLVIAAGFSGHGFCLGPVTGRICAALARDERPNLPIEPFRRARFATAPAAGGLPGLHG